MKKRVIALLMTTTIVASSILVAGCGKKEQTEENEEEVLLEVEVVSPGLNDINIEGQYVGTLEYNEEVTVYPLLSGEITGTFFEEGDTVSEGEVMFTLDDAAYMIQLQNANATYASAKNGLDQSLGSLSMQRDSAVNNVETAMEGVDKINDTKAYYDEQMSDLDRSRADLQEDRNEYKQDLEDMRSDKKKAEDNLEKATGEYKAAAQAYYEAMAVKASTPMTPGSASANAVDAGIEALKNRMDGCAQQVSALGSQVAGYTSGEAQLESAIKSIDASLEQMDSSKEGLQFQKDSLEESLAQANRGVALAQESLQYFDEYTAPKTQESADISLSQARLGITSAELQLSYTKVEAPVSGTIIKKNYDANDLAQAGYPVYVILPDDTMNVSFNVPESVWRTLSIGQAVSVERTGAVYEGTITEVPAQINQQTGMFTVKAKIKGDTSNLSTGTAVTVTATTKHIDEAITIPIDSVYYEGGNAYTYTVKDGIISKVYIETGSYDDDNMEILNGITEDMKVITTWSSDLHDGLKVNVREVEGN